MDINLLRKRLIELQENFKAGNIAPELPGMENTYEPINQDTTGTNNAPEIVEPIIPETTIPEPETQPIYEPEEDDFNMPAAVPAVNTVSQSANNPATAPKMGQNGLKALDEILPDVPEHYKEERSKALTDAYDAGLNGLDITQEIRADAAVGGYLEQIEAMYNAGQQDAIDSETIKTQKEEQNAVDNSKNSNDDFSTEAARREHIRQRQDAAQAKAKAANGTTDDLSTEGARREHILLKKIDNQANSGYNSGETMENNNGISLTAGSELIDFDEVGEDGLKISDVSFYDDEAKKNVECVVYANNRAREYWGIEGYFGITEAVSGFGTAPFLEPHYGSDMQTLIDMPSHSLAFFGPTPRNWRGHEVFIEGKDDKYIYFSESNYGDAPTNGKVQRITYEEFLKRGGGFIGYAAIDMTKYKK